MPPGVSFEQDSPRQTDNAPVSSRLVAEDVVQIPDEEATKEDAEACFEITLLADDVVPGACP